MPTLNPEIFKEILQSILDKYQTYTVKIEIFMLSGKEPFEAVLNYFSRTDCVTVYRNSIEFEVKEKCIRLDYDHALLKSIFKAVGNSAKKLEVRDPPTEEKEREFLKNLIVEGLQKVVLSCDLPDVLFDRLKNLSSIKEVSLEYYSDITNTFNFLPQCESLEIEFDFEKFAEIPPKLHCLSFC
uniref:Uncharacterized protein n=1 Tax=Panagrolaimus davidi TaxID=227884 RepID=A0A914QBM7_9BILA